MKLKIKLFDKNLSLPEYQTDKAAALDLYARVDITIAPKKVGYVPLNIALELPPDHWALLAARSSLHKKGLMMANGIGVGDEDYCGDNDEYQAALLNFTNQPVVVKKGERIAQLIILPRERIEIEEVAELGNKDRGGLGTTGY
ncbi:dUTP diphosphatase [Patescibacteria group bacterium]|nr:dUTP diphosphatase [Patescibacteria group bacterium]